MVTAVRRSARQGLPALLRGAGGGVWGPGLGSWARLLPGSPVGSGGSWALACGGQGVRGAQPPERAPPDFALEGPLVGPCEPEPQPRRGAWGEADKNAVV